MAESGLHPALLFAEKEIRKYLLLAGLDEKSLPEICLRAGEEADDAGRQGREDRVRPGNPQDVPAAGSGECSTARH